MAGWGGAGGYRRFVVLLVEEARTGVHYASGSYSWYSSCGVGKERDGERAQVGHGPPLPPSPTPACPRGCRAACTGHLGAGRLRALLRTAMATGALSAGSLCPPRCPVPPCHPVPSPAGAPRSSPPLAPAAARPVAPQQPPGPPPPAGGERGGQSHAHSPPRSTHPPCPCQTRGSRQRPATHPGYWGLHVGGTSGAQWAPRAHTSPPSWEVTGRGPWEQGLGVRIPAPLPAPAPGRHRAGTMWAPAGSRRWQGCGSILHPWQGRAVLGNPSPGLAERLAGGKGGRPIPPCSSGGSGGLISSADAILG